MSPDAPSRSSSPSLDRGPSSRPSRRPGGDAEVRRRELARVRFRRAITLLVMTLVLPGSAQLVAGRREVGRLAIRVWLGCLALVAAVLGVSYLWHGFAFSLGSSTLVLGLVRFGLCALAVGWALLLIDAWRLGRPLELERRQRLVVVGLNGLMVFVVAGSLLFASNLVAVQRGFITAMFGDGVASAAEHGRYNVLLIGGDAGDGRFGLRTDSMTVASIDEETGRTVLFGLPRNMTGFPFPDGSVLDEAFPDGFDCEGCTLNGLATWAAENPELFAGSETPGIDATVMGIEGITGLKINYYALVNMEGFRGLVDAMGGVTLNVRDRIPVGSSGQKFIEPGVRKLNGYHTLWFARSRQAADDYSRMARQKCVMNAMLRQISPRQVLMKFEEFARAGEELVDTNLPASELDTFAQLALKAKGQPMASVSFVPPEINTSDPDIAKVHSMIEAAIESSEDGVEEEAETAPPTEEPSEEPADKSAQEAAEAPAAPGTGAAPPTDAAPEPSQGFAASDDATTTGGSIGSLSEGYAANQSEDLSQAC